MGQPGMDDKGLLELCWSLQDGAPASTAQRRRGRKAFPPLLVCLTLSSCAWLNTTGRQGRTSDRSSATRGSGRPGAMHRDSLGSSDAVGPDNGNPGALPPSVNPETQISGNDTFVQSLPAQKTAACDEILAQLLQEQMLMESGRLTNAHALNCCLNLARTAESSREQNELGGPSAYSPAFFTGNSRPMGRTSPSYASAYTEDHLLMDAHRECNRRRGLYDFGKMPTHMEKIITIASDSDSDSDSNSNSEHSHEGSDSQRDQFEGPLLDTSAAVYQHETEEASENSRSGQEPSGWSSYREDGTDSLLSDDEMLELALRESALEQAKWEREHQRTAVPQPRVDTNADEALARWRIPSFLHQQLVIQFPSFLQGYSKKN